MNKTTLSKQKLALLNLVIPKKSTLPVLGQAYFHKGKFIATNLEGYLQVEPDSATNGSFFGFAIPKTPLIKPMNEINFKGKDFLPTINGIPLSIGCIADKNELPNYPHDQKMKLAFELNDEINQGIIDSLPFTSTDEMKSQLLGVNVRAGRKTEICATDGHKLITTAFKHNTKNKKCERALIPNDAVKFMAKLKLLKLDYTVSINQLVDEGNRIENRVIISGTGFKYICRTNEMRYPEYENVIPKHSKSKRFDIKDFNLKYLEHFNLGTLSENDAQIVTVGKSGMTGKVVTNNIHQEFKMEREKMPLCRNAEPIGYNKWYLLSVLKNISGKFIMRYGNSLQATLFFRLERIQLFC